MRCCVCVCVCILCILAVLYLVFSSYVPPLSSFAGGTDGYVFGGVITGCIVFISCIVIVARLRVWLMARKRSRNVEAAQANPTSAGTGTGRRVCHVPTTNPDPPPPYVLSTVIQSSDPPPYPPDPPPYPTDNCLQPTSVEDTPTPQPLPPESDPTFPNDEDPPEYLPPPVGDQQQTPL